ncbi:AI-2E family transporter [Haladaptatus sp. NG-SE-30]
MKEGGDGMKGGGGGMGRGEIGMDGGRMDEDGIDRTGERREPEFAGNRSRLAWWTVGIIFGVLLLFVLYSFLGTVVLGLFMYYATRPVADGMAKRLGYPGVTAAVALLVVAVPVVVLFAYTVAVSASEVAAIAGGSVAEYEDILRPYLDLSSVRIDPQQFLDFARENRGEFTRLGGTALLGSVANVVAAFGTALLQLFVAVALAFYLLRDDDRLVRWFVRDIGGERSTAYAYATAVDRSLQTVYFGSILSAFVVALAAAVVFNLADLVAPAGLSIPLPTLLGLLTGIASLIPVVGTKLVYVPVAAFLVVRALGRNVVVLWFPVAFVLVLVVVIDLVTESVVRPYTSGRELHVGLMLFAYIFGPLLFGWYGLFLGPLLLVLLVQFSRIVLPELLEGEPIPTRSVGRDTEVESDGTESDGEEKAEDTEEREVENEVDAEKRDDFKGSDETPSVQETDDSGG